MFPPIAYIPCTLLSLWVYYGEACCTRTRDEPRYIVTSVHPSYKHSFMAPLHNTRDSKIAVSYFMVLTWISGQKETLQAD